MRILVAMSGGIDSSVVAHLLHEQGHELIGVMMKLWTDPLAPPVRKAIPTKCCSLEHIQRARSVCEDLGIPFYVINIEEEFKKQVVDPFLEGYEKGETPNPCIECNRNIKFGTLLTKAKELGCEKLATGHYARVIEERLPSGKVIHTLLEAIDKQKDQSYYLFGLDQDQLQNVLFPLGEMDKRDVYSLAEKFNVPLYDSYTESQDLCFYPEKEPEEFLKRYIKDTKPGEIKTLDGTVVGTHKGLPFYTIGQRKGLGIGGLQIPLHVVKKEQKNNTIFVAKNGDDLENTVLISKMFYQGLSPSIKEELEFEGRIHSLGSKKRGKMTIKGDFVQFQFYEPIRGIAPGQYLVLYEGEKIVGGGKIVEAKQ